MSDNTVASYLAEHPKMTGVLFTALMLLSQTGAVIAGNTGGGAGP
jgi:hypothetical protein